MSTGAYRLLDAARAVGLLGQEVREAIVEEARRARRDPVDVASSRLRLPREAFYRALAEQRGLPFVEADALVPDPALLALAPGRLLARKEVLPLRREGQAVLLATADPEDEAALGALRRAFDAPLALALADPLALRAALRRCLGPAAGQDPGDAGGAAAGASFDAVGYLEDLVRQAWLRRASDVHLDPQPDGLHVRLRVDGRLTPAVGVLPQDDAAALVSRVKVLGGLDIAERREPQDGGFTHPIPDLGGQTLDVRLATIPTRHGERATLRLLGLETSALDLDRLGFAPGDLARFREALAQPHGMVLLTGPTGAGKTTTLYAALREVATPAENVMTVEDPVEVVLPGVSQVQVDRVGKISFARALRSILRHDPDVIMVGEIRDQETADVAVKAAMTGHLVLSSLHTNRAAGAPARLIDLGCEPFLVASVLRAVVAQRLVRRLCARCAAPRPATLADARLLLGPEARDPAQAGPAGADPAQAGPGAVHEPVGCARCMGTGYAGRLALVEGLWVDEALERAIDARAGEEALRRLARERGGRSLAEDAWAKVLAGATSLGEALQARI